MQIRLLLVLSLFLCNTGYSFVVSGNFWESGQATYHVGLTGTASSGVSWNTSFKRAMDAWSAATNFQFLAVDSFKDPCIGRLNGGFGDNISGINFTPDICGNAYGSSTIAVTLTAGTCLNQQCTGGFKITDADIVFKQDENWNVYSGPLQNNSIDFERVALHELGHALGLRHETSNSAVMQAKVSDTHTLQADDINGANAIYGGATIDPEPVFSSISSIYGVDIFVPDTTLLTGPSNNVTLSGSLSSTDVTLNGRFLDLYQFTFTNDSEVNLQLNSSEVDAFLYLVRITSTQDGVPEFTFTDDNSGSGSNALIAKSLQAGTYWIGVSTTGFNEQGKYNLSLISANSNPTSSFQSFQSVYGVSIQVNPNPVIAGSLSNTDFTLNGKHLDLFQFTVVNQTNVRLDLSSNDFDTVLLLTRLHPNASQSAQEIDESFLLQNDDFGGSLNSRLEQVLPPGNYWIGVTSAGTAETGDYQIDTTVLIP